VPNLQTMATLCCVQMLLGKNRTLRNEVDSHEPTIINVVDLGLSMIEEGHEQSEEFQTHINELNAMWAQLQEAVDQRDARIKLSEVAQQVYIALIYWNITVEYFEFYCSSVCLFYRNIFSLARL
jgi:Spectrin repeat